MPLCGRYHSNTWLFICGTRCSHGNIFSFRQYRPIPHLCKVPRDKIKTKHARLIRYLIIIYWYLTVWEIITQLLALCSLFSRKIRTVSFPCFPTSRDGSMFCSAVLQVWNKLKPFSYDFLSGTPLIGQPVKTLLTKDSRVFFNFNCNCVKSKWSSISRHKLLTRREVRRKSMIFMLLLLSQKCCQNIEHSVDRTIANESLFACS